MIELMGDKSLTIDEMVEQKFCLEMNIMRYTLVTRCAYLLKKGVFESKLVDSPTTTQMGILHRTKVKSYRIAT
jgi:hypothetical protein